MLYIRTISRLSRCRKGVARSRNRLVPARLVTSTRSAAFADSQRISHRLSARGLYGATGRRTVCALGDAAHTMSPAGAIGVNVAIATAAVAAQELYPRLGKGPIARTELHAVQRLREPDVRTLHQLQLRLQRVLLTQDTNWFVRWAVPKLLPIVLRSPLLPRLQRRMFFGAPLPPLDPAFGFREDAGTSRTVPAIR